jgi:hypothetical protein
MNISIDHGKTSKQRVPFPKGMDAHSTSLASFEQFLSEMNPILCLAAVVGKIALVLRPSYILVSLHLGLGMKGLLGNCDPRYQGFCMIHRLKCNL